MRRIAALAAVVLAAALVVVAFAGAAAEEDGYKVRAIFDNAGFAIPGEDVKVAGVRVGAIDAVDVTEDFRAAVVLDIEDPGFRDFRRDARCSVRPQSLIGERFVECTLTRPRGAGEPAPPPLRRIEDGPGEGQYLLPVEQTDRVVDLDLINDIYRLPYRQRLSIILNELGTALAGRGEDLNEVIRRANPAMRELQGVLRILAEQNRVLRRLAVDSDRAIAPLARERRAVSGFVRAAADVGQATVERRAQLEGTFRRLPRFLRELRPTMRRLGGLADRMTPVLSDLGDAAPDVNTFVRELGPFSAAALPALDTLGDAGRVATEALEASRPVFRQTASLGRRLRPVGTLLADVLTSFEANDGIERAMDFLFYTVSATNGFDEFGHYLRAALIVNTCSTYTAEPISGCESTFAGAGTAASAAGASTQPRDEILRRTAAVLAGADPAAVLADAADDADDADDAEPAVPAAAVPAAGQAADAPAVPDGGAAAPAEAARDEALLDYLFGRDAP